MALLNLPTITIPKGALFYITAFLVVFYFFFTERVGETGEGDTTPTQTFVG